jgi:DNA-binding LacI/PurR family transcriptional regulator
MSSTIRDVARRAGVGLGTVSRVLNNSPLVSPATRQRVLDVIDELQYAPSQIARSLSLGKTLTIATIAPFFTRPSVVERLRGIEATLAGSNYNLVVFNVETVERRDALLRDVPRRERIDGLLVVSLEPTPNEILRFTDAGVPVVLVDRGAAGLSSVGIDDRWGGYLATRHLIELGHRRIAFLGDPLEDPLNFNFTSSRDRFHGYCQALHDAAITYDPAFCVYGLHGRFEARRLARQLLSLPQPPTAIFAASDTQAMGVLEAAREAAIDVPHALSVIGFDDIDVAEYLALTTIRQPLFETGVRGVDQLLHLLDQPDAGPMVETMPLELVVRNTTASPGRQ